MGVVKTIILAAGAVVDVLCHLIDIAFSLSGNAAVIIRTLPVSVKSSVNINIKAQTCVVKDLLGTVVGVVADLLPVS